MDFIFPSSGLETLPVMHQVRQLCIDVLDLDLEPLDILEFDLSLKFPNLEVLIWAVQDC